MAANEPPQLLHILGHDVGSVVVRFLDPICATKLRGACRSSRVAVTAAQRYWQTLCCRMREPSTSIPPTCWHGLFVQDHAASHMRHTRRKRLTQALHERRLQLREDSWLCSGYIDGQPQVGSLGNVVDGVELMAFLFRETRYAELRDDISQEHWMEAMAMAADAHDAGERNREHGVWPSSYHLALDAQELSDLAKRRAVEEWARTPSTHAVPRVLQDRVARLQRGETGVWDVDGEQPPPVPYESLDATQRAARRVEVSRVVAERMREETAALEPHLSALNSAAAGAIGHAHAHRFPASLSKRQRARLHDEAEALDLAHESSGGGRGRCLVVWRVH
tara:strand:+ start:753 stop:1757 length:1005 start_codon:yes stop_codon:yes gene_type:complete